MCGGGGVRPGPSGIKKALTTFFLFFYFKFLVLSLFYRSPVVTFNENYHFPRFQSGWNIFQGGGSNFFQGCPIAFSL